MAKSGDRKKILQKEDSNTLASKLNCKLVTVLLDICSKYTVFVSQSNVSAIVFV